MRRPGPVALVVDSGVALVAEASVEEASAVTAVTAAIDLDLAAELVIKEAAMDSLDNPLQMPLPAPAVDVVVVVVGSEAVMVVETDLTVVQPAATESLSGPETATLTVANATTVVTVTATGTGTVCQTAMETATATVTAIVTVTGMAAERTTDGSDTVRMMSVTTHALGDDTIKRAIFLISHGSYPPPLLSPGMLVGIPDFSVACPFLRKVNGVRRELKQCNGKWVQDV